ncbi:MAG: phosphate signaling complex protein PhoU [Mycobacteriaceae bacterium]|nr:phosphate signaling complex protein PhoU [Mycobacteriaceae bacterium]
MRTAFREQLEGLTASLAVMCELSGTAMGVATRALIEADVVAAEEVIGHHGRLSEMRTQAEQHAITLLALQAPVARDLRAVVGSLQIAADAERMGGLAHHVARIVRRRHPVAVLPEEMTVFFAEMGHAAVDMSTSAGDVVLSCDPRQAAQLRQQDEAMNALHYEVLSALVDREWNHGVETAVDVTLLGRFYERFADHAVEIGRRVIFQATGQFTESSASN